MEILSRFLLTDMQSFGRVGAIQLDILSLFPLLKFSSVEPDFGRPFNAPTMSSLISKHQLILGMS